MKLYGFYLHYNKPYSQRFKTHKWSVHFKGKCYIVDKIVCNPKTESKLNKRQPHVAMQGFSEKVEEKNGIITIF